MSKKREAMACDAGMLKDTADAMIATAGQGAMLECKRKATVLSFLQNFLLFRGCKC